MAIKPAAFIQDNYYLTDSQPNMTSLSHRINMRFPKIFGKICVRTNSGYQAHVVQEVWQSRRLTGLLLSESPPSGEPQTQKQ